MLKVLIESLVPRELCVESAGRKRIDHARGGLLPGELRPTRAHGGMLGQTGGHVNAMSECQKAVASTRGSLLE